jgi:hypothetical protein
MKDEDLKISRGEVSPSLQPGPKLPVFRYPLVVEFSVDEDWSVVSFCQVFMKKKKILMQNFNTEFYRNL